MEMYLLKSAACLAFLLLFYKLLLERESFHVFKRYYLLTAVIVSGFIPLITFQTYIQSPIVPMEENWLMISEASSESTTNWIYLFLLSLYFSGVVLFGGKFLWNLSKIINRIRENKKFRTEKVSAVLLPEDLPPHTFWNYIFLNKQKFEKGQIPKEVFDHEKAHAVQKHTLDILFLELLQVFLWFNPLIYLLKKSVKLNHEFLADRAVLSRGINTASYQELLLSFSSGNLQSSLVNPINYSLIKKRFTVMKTRTSKTTSVLKGFLLLPLLAGLLYGFSSKEVLLLENNSEETKDLQEKATPKMLAEYNRLVKHYNSIPREKLRIKKDEINRIMYILSLMTPEQKEKAEKIKFDVPPPPPPLPTINKNENVPAPPPPPPAPPVTKDGNIPSPPPAPPVEKAGEMQAPPPPPPPSPVEAVQGWIEEGAEFFYNGKKISEEEALKIVKQNNGKNLRVQVEENESGKTVRLSENKR
ncbi:M56 family metallopeptidase [Salinimicrobium flavum]|uniref:M56 family metallopeptidase n=1 Tax=Salinimicrobium flavum TaxID=1737065 RepID=A0ABW5IV91_9FLAO